MNGFAYTQVTIIFWRGLAYVVNAVDPEETWKSWNFDNEDDAVRWMNELKDVTMAEWAARILLEEPDGRSG